MNVAGTILYILSMLAFNVILTVYSVDKDVLLIMNIVLGILVAPYFLSGKVFNK